MAHDAPKPEGGAGEPATGAKTPELDCLRSIARDAAPCEVMRVSDGMVRAMLKEVDQIAAERDAAVGARGDFMRMLLERWDAAEVHGVVGLALYRRGENGTLCFDRITTQEEDDVFICCHQTNLAAMVAWRERAERAEAERGALHCMLTHAVIAHPLPWRIEQDWTWEVIAADGTTVAKCTTPAEAQAVVSAAESFRAFLTTEVSDARG